jgi:predicted amidohydrolase YtcJ
MAATVRLLGRQRTRAVSPIHSLIAAGDSVGYGSDWDNVPEPNPWRALQLMVTRQDPANPDAGYLARAEAVDVMTGLEILTISGAYGLGLEDSTGSIEVGKDADLIVLNQDVLRAPASEIHKTKVLRTILMGRTIFAASTSLASTASK